MKTYKTVRGLRRALSTYKRQEIAFVPTMGALHQGHLSLVETAKKHAAVTVVSIFVNPTQFNEKSDLDKYPRTVSKDSKLLRQVKTTYLFVPSVKQIYPLGTGNTVDIDLRGLADVSWRVHFARGISKVCSRSSSDSSIL